VTFEDFESRLGDARVASLLPLMRCVTDGAVGRATVLSTSLRA
jgi:hypothetical protein